MDQRHANYHQAEQAVLAHLARHTEAVPARTVAMELGWPWRVVARVLARLVAAGSVRRVEHISRDSRYRRRVEVRYRAMPVAHLSEALPAWLAPRVHPVTGARLVVGRATLGA